MLVWLIGALQNEMRQAPQLSTLVTLAASSDEGIFSDKNKNVLLWNKEIRAKK